MRTPIKLALGLLAAAGLAFGAYGLGADRAFAGDEAPAAAPAAKAPASEAPATTTEAPATKTETPFHSIIMYVGQQVCGGECVCASTPEGSAKWSAWFDSKDAVMPGLKAALIADGWTKERFVGFFQAMAKAKSGDCCGKCESGEACDEGCNCPNKAKAEGVSGSASDAAGCGKCGEGCCKNKAKSDGAAAPTGDASGSASDEGCTKCPSGCCGGKKKAEKDVPATTNG